MAITLRNVYPQMVEFENLWEAYRKARRGKRYKEAAASFDMNAPERIFDLRRELVEGTWMPGRYYHFYIHEPKKRLISAAPFRDRVVHHAVVNVLEPFYEARFSESSFACRKGKGTHAAIEKAHWGIRNCRWFLKGDLVRFFPSIDHDVMKTLLRRKIGDRQLMEVIDRIIDSGAGVLDAECPPMWFEGDDLLSPGVRPKGLPIGNLTSQFFANVLLNELDQFVHSTIQPRMYVRYSDDFLLLDSDKEKLCEARSLIGDFCAGLRLQCHPRKTCVRPASQGVRFLGFRLLPQTRRIAPESVSRFRKRMRAFSHERKSGVVDMERVSASVRGWLHHAGYANSTALVREVLADVRI